MTLIRVSGSVLLDSLDTPKDLFVSQTGLKHYATTVFLDNTLNGPPVSIVILRVFTFDNTGPGEELYDYQVFKGAQDSPAVYVPFIPVEGGYKITAERSSSANITIKFDRYEAT